MYKGVPVKFKIFKKSSIILITLLKQNLQLWQAYKKTCVEMILVKIKNTKGSKVNIMNLIKYVIEALRFRFLYLK